MELPTRIDRPGEASEADVPISQLRSGDPRTRRAAVEALAATPMPTLKVVAALAIAAKSDADGSIRSFAHEALRRVGVDPEDAMQNVPK